MKKVALFVDVLLFLRINVDQQQFPLNQFDVFRFTYSADSYFCPLKITKIHGTL
jgi:hypothetical protein